MAHTNSSAAGAMTAGRTHSAEPLSGELLSKLPAELGKHVEDCWEKFLDLVPWIDPHGAPPVSPLAALVEQYIADFGSGRYGNGKPPSPHTIRQKRRSIIRVI